MSLTQEKIKEALTYYLWHLRLDLKLGRMEFLRDNADKICAIANGYISSRGRGTGDFERFKLSCYASRDAIEKLNVNGWSATGLRQEHVIPLKVVGEILLKEKAQNLSDVKLIHRLNSLVIPCVITLLEDRELETQKMPYKWTDPWVRYKQKGKQTGRILYKEVFALQKNTPFHFKMPPPYMQTNIPPDFAVFDQPLVNGQTIKFAFPALPKKTIFHRAKNLGVQGLYTSQPLFFSRR